MSHHQDTIANKKNSPAFLLAQKSVKMRHSKTQLPHRLLLNPVLRGIVRDYMCMKKLQLTLKPPLYSVRRNQYSANSAPPGHRLLLLVLCWRKLSEIYENTAARFEVFAKTKNVHTSEMKKVGRLE